MLSEYDNLEKHIQFSIKLYTLNQNGRNILAEFAKNKATRIKRTGEPEYNSEIVQIVQALQDTLNYRKFCFRLFFNLQYYLDELLFTEVSSLKSFFIEDNEYELAKLYFDYNWLENRCDIKEYKFYKDPDISIDEAMYLVCYLKEYDSVLLEIESYITSKTKKDIKKLPGIINKIRLKHKVIWDIILKKISDDL